MSSANLALVFGPTLTRAPDNANPHMLHNDVPAINALIQICIEKHSFVFGEEDEEDRLSSPPPPPSYEPFVAPCSPPLLDEEKMGSSPEGSTPGGMASSEDSPQQPSSQEDLDVPPPRPPPPIADAIKAVAATAILSTGVVLTETEKPPLPSREPETKEEKVEDKVEVKEEVKQLPPADSPKPSSLVPASAEVKSPTPPPVVVQEPSPTGDSNPLTFENLDKVMQEIDTIMEGGKEKEEEEEEEGEGEGEGEESDTEDEEGEFVHVSVCVCLTTCGLVTTPSLHIHTHTHTHTHTHKCMPTHRDIDDECKGTVRLWCQEREGA